MQEIIIWDDQAERIHSLESNLRQALMNLKLQARIQINCEPPLLSRNNLTGQTPKIEINQDMWTHKIGEGVSVQEFENLLKKTIGKAV